QAQVAIGNTGATITNTTTNITSSIYDPNPKTSSGTVSMLRLPCPTPAFLSAPVASPSPAQQGQLVSFAAVANDPDNRPQTYAWNFGNGSSGTGAAPQHTYANPGNYVVTVTASNDCGASVSSTI